MQLTRAPRKILTRWVDNPRPLGCPRMKKALQERNILQLVSLAIQHKPNAKFILPWSFWVHRGLLSGAPCWRSTFGDRGLVRSDLEADLAHSAACLRLQFYGDLPRLCLGRCCKLSDKGGLRRLGRIGFRHLVGSPLCLPLGKPSRQGRGGGAKEIKKKKNF
jgi:hypothetical protein